MKMTKHDFKQMTRQELKKYILAHPTDDEAIRELFITRRNRYIRLTQSYPKLDFSILDNWY